jgi:glycosyltransferase involved in cell wall biosynthesis
MNTMRIAMVTDWYLPRLGGIEMQIHDLSTALKAGGLDVEVITPCIGPDMIDGVPIHRLLGGAGDAYRFPPSAVAHNFKDALYLVELLGRQGKGSALSRLREKLRQGKYDVVHAHLGNTPFAYLAVNIALELGLRVVVTFHSVLGAMEQPIAFAISRAIGCQKWVGKVDLTAVSTLVAKNRSFSIGTDNFTVLPNGTDADFWQRAQNRENGPEGRPLTFLSVMRLHPRKRPFLLLESMAALLKRQGAGSSRLYIAGDGHLRQALQKRIEQLGLKEAVTMTGRLNRSEIADYLAQSDLFLMPSYLESFGIAALEARIAGVPILAMGQAGAWDFLTEGTDSMRAENDADFTQKMCDFAEDGQLRATLRAGALTPLTGYAWPDLVARCQRLYAGDIRPA